MSTSEKALNRAECSDEEMRKKRRAFLEIQKMRKKAPDDFDYDKELMEYFDEKYGLSDDKDRGSIE